MYFALTMHTTQKDTTYTKIFVGGLPYHTTDSSLRKYFEVFGEIEEAVVITDRQTGKSRGYGFVSITSKITRLSLLRRIESNAFYACGKNRAITRLWWSARLLLSVTTPWLTLIYLQSRGVYVLISGPCLNLASVAISHPPTCRASVCALTRFPASCAHTDSSGGPRKNLTMMTWYYRAGFSSGRAGFIISRLFTALLITLVKKKLKKKTCFAPTCHKSWQTKCRLMPLRQHVLKYIF